MQTANKYNLLDNSKKINNHDAQAHSEQFHINSNMLEHFDNNSSLEGYNSHNHAGVGESHNIHGEVDNSGSPEPNKINNDHQSNHHPNHQVQQNHNDQGNHKHLPNHPHDGHNNLPHQVPNNNPLNHNNVHQTDNNNNHLNNNSHLKTQGNTVQVPVRQAPHPVDNHNHALASVEHHQKNKELHRLNPGVIYGKVRQENNISLQAQDSGMHFNGDTMSPLAPVPGSNMTSCAKSWNNEFCTQGLNDPIGYNF